MGSGDGVVKVFYDPDRSIRGAKLCVVKKRTEAKTVNYITSQRIIVPYALPMFRYRMASDWPLIGQQDPNTLIGRNLSRFLDTCH